jgi:hypothetical protein
MPRIVVFDEGADPQRVTGVTGKSENQGTWDDSGRTDYVVAPDLSLLATFTADGHFDTYIVPRRYWKHVAGNIVEYTQAEKDAQDAAQDAAHDASVRSSAKSGLTGFHSEPMLLRAFADVIKDEINILRAEHSLAARTLQQLRNAIDSRIDSGDVDA